MSITPPFSERLTAAIQQKQTPTLVGLDPRFESLPEVLRKDVDPKNRRQVAQSFERFCCDVIDVVADRVPAVKPQAAFFERLGPAGMHSMASVIEHAHQRGLLVILDGKRNDIGSTATGYADAYLGTESAWGADALTVSPYLGDDSLTPFVEVARERGAGLFVLAKTSNAGGQLFQDLVCDGKPVYRHVSEYIESLAEQTRGESAYGAVGAVVGATYPAQLEELRAVMRHAWLLIPGFGAQGGSASDVAGGFDDTGLGAIVNSSRAIIFAHDRAEFRDRFGNDRWQEAVSAATDLMIQQLREETPAGRLMD